MEVLVKIPGAMGDALTALAKKTGRSPDEVIADALREYLVETSEDVPRSIGMYADPDLSGADSEDWLRDNWLPR